MGAYKEKVPKLFSVYLNKVSFCLKISCKPSIASVPKRVNYEDLHDFLSTFMGKSLDDLSHESSRLMHKRPNFVF